ncbi:hypothetical protein ACFVHB_34280 [Kitasatospora sp. NPDC127111]|uniref:hypothetical protein n=1 Tax=Kitasatospora sp. NPDC127111 TaxID=3345363 RepID=UPI003639999D
MTATNDAPDPLTAAEHRWQHIEDRLAALEHRIRWRSSAALGALDTHLARLEALRHSLATQPWPPRTSPGPPAGDLRPGGAVRPG